ncbi:Alpha/Beta hydrolase protein [Dendryphion nanum]|uniref:Alpha/Beta hydrolase protein n=1 Tax=Dendryphion nanum TaxID=256645 RepID=A0A9P9EDW6_9PLEO|nr:Alpha/Beta hydrolase protein [Dendryphion nanum]
MIGEFAAKGFAFAYGFTNFLLLTAAATFQHGAFTKRASKEHDKELTISQDKYWNLNKSPIPGFRHAFHTLKNGAQLHYVINNHSIDQKTKSKNVAIFIHGFPDTFTLWKNILQTPDLANYVLIAVDIPGYGGSDSLPSYGPDQVLEALTAFILAMRAQHVEQGGKLVMVSHDWGGLISARLASEAKELADRWIITSAVIPAHLNSNARTFLASSRRMLHTFLAHPFSNFRLLKTAYATSQPVFSQLKRSYYIFVLRLPGPIAKFFIRMGNYWFMGLLHMIQAGLISRGKFLGKFSDKEAADWTAMSSGPGIAQFSEQIDGQGYSESVRRRIADLGTSEKIRIYREGLMFNPWEKSIETVVALSEIPTDPSRSSSGAGLFENGPKGALRVPTTLVLGKYDIAFERRLGTNGISDFLVRNSQVLYLGQSGHWIPFEPHAFPVVASIILWALEGEKVSLREQLQKYEDIEYALEK